MPNRASESSLIPHIGFSAPSGIGKTTLITRLVSVFRDRGLRPGYLKHAHHGFDLDTPGKDSYVVREAGASTVLVASPERWALLREAPGFSDGVEALLGRFDPEATDLVLIEGWHLGEFPRIAVHRRGIEFGSAGFDDPQLIAVATDAPEDVPGVLPLLPLNEPEAIVDFILNHPRLGLPECRARSDSAR